MFPTVFKSREIRKFAPGSGAFQSVAWCYNFLERVRVTKGRWRTRQHMLHESNFKTSPCLWMFLSGSHQVDFPWKWRWFNDEDSESHDPTRLNVFCFNDGVRVRPQSGLLTANKNPTFPDFTCFMIKAVKLFFFLNGGLSLRRIYVLYPN